jgi:hypothetical protein
MRLLETFSENSTTLCDSLPASMIAMFPLRDAQIDNLDTVGQFAGVCVLALIYSASGPFNYASFLLLFDMFPICFDSLLLSPFRWI